jgi:hypothetical protein
MRNRCLEGSHLGLESSSTFVIAFTSFAEGFTVPSAQECLIEINLEAYLFLYTFRYFYIFIIIYSIIFF